MTQSTRVDRPGHVIPILNAELDDFRTEAIEFLAGHRDEPAFIGFRLKQGVYGQRQPGVQMVRVKLPMGEVTADQLDTLAQVAERFAPLQKGHITTRQNVQFHFIPLAQMPDVLDLLASSALSSREACGNTVRNVTCDPWAGVRPDDLFDVTPYAGAFVRYWVRNPISQSLPRKFKVFFTGSPHDAGIAGIHDLAFLAQIRIIDGEPVKGFRIICGGGLSTMAKEAVVLREFVPIADYLRLSEAVLRIFNASDELRQNIHKARIKFLVHRVGPERFRALVDDELQQDWAQSTIPLPDLLFLDDEDADAPPLPPMLEPPPVAPPAFQRFAAKRVRPQRQPGYATIEVKVPQGDLTPAQFRGLAEILRTHGNGRARTTYFQNIVLRWIPNASLYSVWKALAAIRLADPDAGEITDLVSCPGTDSCKLGITSSMGLNRAIQAMLTDLAISDEATRRIRIHISGCPNSCGQHHIANIGFHGAAVKSGTHQIPAYHVFLAGTAQHGALRFGQLVPMRLPAKRVPEAVQRFLTLYQQERRNGEEFNAFFDRVGKEPFEAAVHDLTLPPELSESTAPLFIDWERGGMYVVERGEGECAV